MKNIIILLHTCQFELIGQTPPRNLCDLMCKPILLFLFVLSPLLRSLHHLHIFVGHATTAIAWLGMTVHLSTLYSFGLGVLSPLSTICLKTFLSPWGFSAERESE